MFHVEQFKLLLMSFLGATALMAGGSLLNGIFGGFSQGSANRANRQLAEYSFEQNKLMQDREFQHNIDMWNQQNAYNSPTEQMARLKSAGLNPNLVYGNGAVGNTTSNAPQYNAPKYQPPQMNAYTGWNLGIGDALSRAAQTELNKTQADSIRTSIDTEKLKQANMVIQNSRDSVAKHIAEETQEAVINKAYYDSNRAELQMGRENYQLQQDQIDTDIKRMLSNEGVLQNLSRGQLSMLNASISRVLQTTDFEKFEQDLYKATGLTRGDGLTIRILRALTEAIGLDTGSLNSLFNPSTPHNGGRGW